MRIVDNNDAACLFCGGRKGVKTCARDDGAAAVAICASCLEDISRKIPSPPTESEPIYSDAAKAMMAKASAMTEEAFEDTYLSDLVDRVIFEYVRGYGRTTLDGNALGLLTVMTEKSADVLVAHILKMEEAGLIYPIAGSPGEYGADYAFADD